MSDIRLDDDNGTSITLDADLVGATASDFLLDNAARHTGTHKLRRALVHDQKDGLTINYNDDYPGGVTINDVVAIHSRGGISISNVKEVSGVKLSESRSSDGGRTAGASSDTATAASASLLLRGHVMIEVSPDDRTETASLQNVIGELRSRVETLSRTVAALSGKSVGTTRGV